jgi:hypothetical protein
VDPAPRLRLPAIVAVLCALALLAGCSPGGDDAADPADPANAARAVRDAATAAAGGATVTTASTGPARGRSATTTGSGTVDFRDGTAALSLRISRIGADLPALLAGLRDDVALVGPEPIDGTPATHYRGTVDLAAVAGAAPALAPLVARLRTELSTSLLPVEVWVDRTGRLRRVVEVLRPADLPGGGATATMTLADPGPRAAATAPAAVGDRDLLADLEQRAG